MVDVGAADTKAAPSKCGPDVSSNIRVALLLLRIVYHRGGANVPHLEFAVRLESPFDLEYTLESGQVFRWEHRGEWWFGVVDGGVLKVKLDGETLSCKSSTDRLDGRFVANYFRLDEDPRSILSSIRKDSTITRAVQKFYGMRLLRQDPWESLASFVLATNSNIPRIKQMVSNVSASFGQNMAFEGGTYSTFPTAGALAEAGLTRLRKCGLGYRAPFLKRVAEAVDRGKLDFSELSLVRYEKARETLLGRLLGEKLLLGVGPKVADCVLLFSCGKDQAFPIDVWVARSLLRFYPSLVGPSLRRKLGSTTKKNLTRREYGQLSSAARRHFGKHAGYAQQYLFMLARSEGIA
jgi:N-glycosylase/DNA lyase